MCWSKLRFCVTALQLVRKYISGDHESRVERRVIVMQLDSREENRTCPLLITVGDN